MIRSINKKWVLALEFDTVEEMAESIKAYGLELPEGGLVEGVDYEVAEGRGALRMLNLMRRWS